MEIENIDTVLLDELYSSLSPAERHYSAHKIAVAKYQKSNIEKKRQSTEKYLKGKRIKKLAKKTVSQIDYLYKQFNINLDEFSNNIICETSILNNDVLDGDLP